VVLGCTTQNQKAVDYSLDAPPPLPAQPRDALQVYYAINMARRCIAAGRKSQVHIFVHDAQRELEGRLVRTYLTASDIMHLGHVDGKWGKLVAVLVTPLGEMSDAGDAAGDKEKASSRGDDKEDGKKKEAKKSGGSSEKQEAAAAKGSGDDGETSAEAKANVKGSSGSVIGGKKADAEAKGSAKELKAPPAQAAKASSGDDKEEEEEPEEEDLDRRRQRRRFI